MGLLYDAAQLAYQAYFFDNSHDDSGHEPFAHFKAVKEKKVWDEELKALDPGRYPNGSGNIICQKSGNKYQSTLTL
ncbi:MAG: hypothetical protein CMQ38_07035 [Gammaproteobacteria bacterium]|nr:hypothetical protein [Gammaproteobacteria bacterium]